MVLEEDPRLVMTLVSSGDEGCEDGVELQDVTSSRSMLPLHTAFASFDASHANFENDESPIKQRIGLRYLLSTLPIAVAITSIILELMSILLHRDGTIIYISVILGIVVSFLVLYRQVLLNKVDSFRSIHNKLREEVNRLTSENNKLHRNIDELQDEVDNVKNIEDQLRQIAQSQNSNVNELLSLAKENSIIVKKQGECAKASFAEQLLTTVLLTDRNKDLRITDREATMLVMRLQNQPGLNFNEQQLRGVLKKTKGSISAIITLLRDLEEEDYQNEAKIFDVDVEDFANSFRNNQ